MSQIVFTTMHQLNTMNFYENKKTTVRFISAILVIALAVGMVLSFSGCTSNEPAPTTEATDPAASTTAPTEPEGTKGTEATQGTEATEATQATEATEPGGDPTEATDAADPSTPVTTPSTEATEPAPPATEPTVKPTEAPTEPKPTEHQHSYTTKITKQPTCYLDGERVKTCSCGHSYTETIPATLCKEELVKKVPATCVEQGYDLMKCAKCGEERRRNLTDPLGHSYGEWKVTVEATATAEGREECTCSRCGDLVFRTIPKTGSGETAKTDVYTVNRRPAGAIYPERDIYSADDNSIYGDGCHVIVMDQQINRPAHVEHIGYLTLKVTFIDNTNTTQVVIVQIGGADYPAEKYALVQFAIKPDGTSEWFTSSHAS